MAFLAALLLLAGPAAAHDFWLGADPAAGGKRPIRLWVGHLLEVEGDRPYEAERNEALRLITSATQVDAGLLGRPGQKPFLSLPDSDETRMLALDRRWVLGHTATRENFARYLAEEGLDGLHIKFARQPVRATESERYRRYLKLLLRGTANTASVAATDLGQRLEILLPRGIAATGKDTKVCVRFEGQPLPDRRLSLLSGGSANGPLQTRIDRITDGEGCANMPLTDSGFQLLRLVHLRACTASDCGNDHWESFWAAYAIQP